MLVGVNSAPFCFGLAKWRTYYSRGLPPKLFGCGRRHALGYCRRFSRGALDWRQDNQRHIIPLHDNRYPALLKEIPDPPILLYVAGSLEALTLPQIAIVGSRKASPGGRAMARRLAGELAGGGYSVCSGMALGIDTESHMGAFEKQGSSVAVLGSGIDQLYPRANKKLAE